MQILKIMSFMMNFSLCLYPSIASVQLPKKIFPFEHIDRKYPTISLKDYIPLDMYFPSKKHFQFMLLKHNVSQSEFQFSCKKIINYRDSMIYRGGWGSILDKFDFSRNYKNMSVQFIKALKYRYNNITRYVKVSCADARLLSVIESTATYWKDGIKLLEETYSAEGMSQSLEDAVALVFLHIYPPRPYSPPLFASLRSRFSESYRSTSEAARLEHDRKEKEDFIFFMKCMANAIAMIEKKDPQELFGYDAVEGATSFTITDGTTSSKVGSLKSTSLSGADGSAVVSRRTGSNFEKTLSSVGSISSESESSSSHSEKDSEKEDEKEE